MIKWKTDEKGERFPEYTAEQAQRIARAFNRRRGAAQSVG